MNGQNAPDEALPEHGTKSFLGHLEDLRKAISACLISVLVGFVVVLPMAPHILGWLRAPVRAAGLDPETFLQVLRVAGGLSITLRIMLWGGILVALPLILASLIWFVFPGLKPHERVAARWGLGVSIVLFVTGVATAYRLVLPPVIQMMLRINAWLGVSTDFVELGDYVAFVLKMLIAFGFAYELPAIVVLLGFMGFVSSADLRHYRRHVIVGMLILAMLLTPPDPLSQLMMAVPLVVLYEFALWILWLRERRQRKGA